MSRTIEIRGLSDAQCDALAEEAKAAGRKFYDHCRLKLLAGMTVAVRPIFQPGETTPDPRLFERPTAPERPQIQFDRAEASRLNRLEAMMAQMGETLQLLASNPVQLVQAEPETDNPEIDVDDVIGQSLAVAEREGLTVVEREAPAVSGGVRHVGQRRPAPFSVNSVPQHLRNL